MPKSAIFVEERRQRILDTVLEQGRCNVNDLAAKFDVTTATIRSDLKALESTNNLVRTHGGAIPKNQPSADKKVRSYRKNVKEKRLVAEAAVQFVEDDSVIVIDIGSTALSFARELVNSKKKNIAVVSPDLNVLLEISSRPDFRAISISGIVHPIHQYSCGSLAIRALDSFRFDTCFVTTDGIDLQNGLTSTGLDIANLKAKLISSSHSAILLTDYEKFGKTFSNRFADFSDLTHIVVDSIDPQTRQSLDLHKVNVVVATSDYAS